MKYVIEIIYNTKATEGEKPCWIARFKGQPNTEVYGYSPKLAVEKLKYRIDKGDFQWLD